jgi:hypothetical protein
MADFFKILSQKIDFSPTEQGIAERWFRQVERNNLFANSISSGGGGGGVASLAAGNVEIDTAQGFVARNPTTGERTVYMDPDGDAWFGSNIDEPDTTTMFVISNENVYNGETFGAGDLLIGSNSTGKANMWWDASAGLLYFRSGTTVTGTIGSGGLVFSWGTIGGWNINATQIYSSLSAIVLDSSVPSINIEYGKVILNDAGITAIGGEIGGWNMDSTRLFSDLAEVVLDSSVPSVNVGSGKAVLSNSGITAIAGAIGGWVLAATTLQDSGGGIVLDSSNARVRVGSNPYIDIDTDGIASSNFSTGVSGFQILSDSGDAEFNDIKARGLILASTFMYENTTAVGSNLLVSKSGSVLYSNFTSPLFPGNSSSVWVENSEADVVLFAINDVIYVQVFDGTAIRKYWGTITARTIQTGYTELTVTFRSGDASTVFPKGAAVVNYGPSGHGAIALQAGDPADATVPTRVLFTTHAGSPWTTQTTEGVLGNMRGQYGTGANDRYGFGFGDYANGEYISFNAAAAGQFVLESSGGAIKIGSSGIVITDDASAVNYINWKYSDGENIGDIFGDYGGGDIQAMTMRSLRNASSVWDRVYVGLTISDDENSIESRIYGETVTPASTAYGYWRVYQGSLSVDRGLYVGGYSGTTPVGEIRTTGDIYLNVGGTGAGTHYIRGGSGSNRMIRFETGTSQRWRLIGGNTTAESGSNVGSDFLINRYSDAGAYIANALKITRANGTVNIPGDIITTVWTDYSATSTITGWTSYTTKVIEYKKVGNLVFVNFRIAGTSNANTTSFTLPHNETHTGDPINVIVTRDAGTWATGHISVITGTAHAIPTQGAAASAWTTTGLKEIYGQFWYEA